MSRFFLLIIILSLQIACSKSVQRQNTVPQRKPMQKNKVVLRSPEYSANRTMGNGQQYDPNPRIVLIDKKAKKYELRWIGNDGKEKVLKYQGYDAVDVIIRAKATKYEGEFVYYYAVENLSTSSTFLAGFIVQTLAEKVNPLESDDIYVGTMASYIPMFSKGNWFNFGILPSYMPQINPGKNIEFSLSSTARPGIVGCRVIGGELNLKSAGEHMPQELELALPGYEELPYGYTIGPVESIGKMSKKERAKYFVSNLPKFQEAGWISEVTAKTYEMILKDADLTRAQEQAQEDLAKQIITSEIFSIIEGLNR